MSELTKLVPPLELCKLIPAGEFRDSVFIWMEVEASATMKKTWSLMQGTQYARQRPNRKIPAPTLEEIMENMQYCRVYKKTNGSFVAVNEKTRICHINGAAAALKLWIKLKGIEYAE